MLSLFLVTSGSEILKVSMSKKRAEAVYTFISDFLQQHGYAPNLPEIAKGCSLSEGNVEEGLNWLQESLFAKQSGHAASG